MRTPCGTVLLSHGYAEHSASPRSPAPIRRRFYDHAGHGWGLAPPAWTWAISVQTCDARRATLAHARTPDLFLFTLNGGIIAAASTILDLTRLRHRPLRAGAATPRSPPAPADPAGRANQPWPRRRKGASWRCRSLSPVSRPGQVQRDFDAIRSYKGGADPDGRKAILQGRLKRRADRLTTPLVMHARATWRTCAITCDSCAARVPTRRGRASAHRAARTTSVTNPEVRA